MSCGSKISGTQYEELIKTLNKSILEILMFIDVFKKIYHHYNIEEKCTIKSIIIDKTSHLKILEDIYSLVSGESHTILINPEPLEKLPLYCHINSSIKKEFEFINLLKILRLSIPNENLKHAINIILIDENNIVNKLLYINTQK